MTYRRTVVEVMASKRKSRSKAAVNIPAPKVKLRPVVTKKKVIAAKYTRVGPPMVHDLRGDVELLIRLVARGLFSEKQALAAIAERVGLGEIQP